MGMMERIINLGYMRKGDALMLSYKDTVRKILEEVILYEDFEDDIDLIKEGIMDSLTIVYLVEQLEEHFGFTIDESLIVPDNFRSINVISDFLCRLERAK